MKGILVCGGCGEDMARRGGCAVCRNPAILRALGVRRRRSRAWLPASLAALLLLAMVATVGDDTDVRQPTVVAEREAQGLDVIVQPGGASYANFTAGSGGDVIATPGRTEPPQGVYWDVVLPPITLFMGLGGRAAWIAVTPRRLDVVQMRRPRLRLSDEALARALRGTKATLAAGCSDPWLEGIARRMAALGASAVPCGDACDPARATGAGAVPSPGIADPADAAIWLAGVAHRLCAEESLL